MNLRELKYTLIGEDKLSDKFQRVTKSSQKANQALGATSDKVNLLKNHVGEAEGKMRMFDRSLRAMHFSGAEDLHVMDGFQRVFKFISNPILLAAGAVAGLGAAFSKATKAAAEFDLAFRNINLSTLDMAKDKVEDLKSSILAISSIKGFDPSKLAKGYYDIFSMTGLSGSGNLDIAKKQGEFARIMGADFNEYISGSAKAMQNFGFGKSQLDDYNKSVYASVQLGAMTFEEYSKVSAAFAGAATAAGQTYDSANRLFSLFTAGHNKPEEAAEATKRAFMTLFDTSNFNAFQKLNIKLFDAKGAKRQITDILTDLNKVFTSAGTAKGKNDIRNMFTGNEGLIALLNIALDESGKLKENLSRFDSTKFNMGEAVNRMKNDINYINETLTNKKKAAWITTGEAWLPFKNWWKENISIPMINSLTNWALNWFGNEDKRYNFRKNTYGTQIQDEIDSRKMNRDQTYHYYVSQINELEKQYNALEGNTDLQSKIGMQLGTVKEMFNEYRQGIKTEYQNKADNAGSKEAGTGLKAGVYDLAGGGPQQKNIYITIQKFQDSIQIHPTTIKEGAVEMRMELEEELVRVIQGVEQMLN